MNLTTKSKGAFYRRQFGISEETGMSWAKEGLPPYAQKAIKDNFKLADWVQSVLTFKLVVIKEYAKEDFEVSWRCGYYPNDNDGDEVFERYKGKQFEISAEKAEMIIKTNLFDFDNITKVLVLKRIKAIYLAYNTLDFIRDCYQTKEGFDCLAYSYAMGLVLERIRRRLKQEGTLPKEFLVFSDFLGLAGFVSGIYHTQELGFIPNWKKLGFTMQHKNLVRRFYRKKKREVEKCSA